MFKSDMKSKLLVFFAAAVLFSSVISAGGCNGDSEANYSKKPEEAMKVEKVSDYLYKTRYDDLDESVYSDTELIRKFFKITTAADKGKAFACSAVVNGNFYGRNFDFFMGQDPNFVVWVEGNDKRYASIGVVMMQNVSLAEADSGELSEDMKKLLPFVVLDGINEKGVTCNSNYVPKEVEHDSTNPGAKDLPYLTVVRYVLDNAESAAHAVELLKGRNLVNKPDVTTLHWMIADPKESYVVEVVDNELRVVKNPEAMTNYYLSVDGYTPHACGIERMDIIKKGYDKAASVENMRRLMQSVYYTQAYKKSTKPFWYSEHYQYDSATGKDYNINTPMDELQPHVDKIAEDFSRCTRDNPDGFWETVYTSVYDMSKQTMRISLHEDYSKYWDFKLK